MQSIFCGFEIIILNTTVSHAISMIHFCRFTFTIFLQEQHWFPVHVWVCVYIHPLFAFESVCVFVCMSVPKCIVYVCIWHNFLPISFHNLNQRKCINFAGVREAYTEPVNKSLLLLPTMPCQVHTSSQHIIINCTLNYSVQLTMREWTEREGGEREMARVALFEHSF